MSLSDVGKIARDCWRKIPDHFLFARLGEWVIMPNYVHGILVFDRPLASPVETPKLGVSTNANTNTNMNTANANMNHWKPGNLGVVINQYKRACTIQSRKTNPDFAWQPRFYDRVIRNEKELHRISEYIVSNPRNWKKDDYFYTAP